jgi:hypothetical protein
MRAVRSQLLKAPLGGLTFHLGRRGSQQPHAAASWNISTHEASVVQDQSQQLTSASVPQLAAGDARASTVSSGHSARECLSPDHCATASAGAAGAGAAAEHIALLPPFLHLAVPRNASFSSRCSRAHTFSAIVGDCGCLACQQARVLRVPDAMVMRAGFRRSFAASASGMDGCMCSKMVAEFHRHVVRSKTASMSLC